MDLTKELTTVIIICFLLPSLEQSGGDTDYKINGANACFYQTVLYYFNAVFHESGNME